MVLSFHGTTSYPEEQLALSGMGPKADALGKRLGHQWPGSPVDIGPDFGAPEPDYDGTGRILAFFDAHR